MTIAYLGLGSNIEDRKAYLRFGLSRLESMRQVKLLKASSLYESDAWGLEDQPYFYNLCAEIETSLEPEALLRLLKEVEQQAGRLIANTRWEPRELDIDILLFGNRIIGIENLTIPHTHLMQRQFVLLPLAEIASEAVIPGKCITVGRALSLCSDKGRVELVGSLR